LEIAARQADCERIGNDGNIRPAIELSGVEIATTRFGVAFIDVGRLVGDDTYSASRGILSEQRTLRPSQDLDAVDVNKISQSETTAVAIDAVDKNANSAFETCIVTGRADAAHTDRGVGHRAARRVNKEARGQDLEIVNVADL